MSTTHTLSKTQGIVTGLVSGIALLMILNPGFLNINEEYKWLTIGIGIFILLASIFTQVKAGYYSKANQNTIEFKAGMMQLFSMLGFIGLSRFTLTPFPTLILSLFFVILFVYSFYLIWSKG